MFCKYCGKEIADDAIFCKYCGNKRSTNIVNEDTPITNGNSTPRKSPKKKHTALKIVLSILFIGIVAVIGVFVWRVYLSYKNNDYEISERFPSKEPNELDADDFIWNEIPYDSMNVINEEYETYYDSLKSMESDIDGMTVYDKYQRGMRIEAGSDTDRDGITDKDEIEIYGTDPLKMSTAGDLYTDGYKLDHGMDLFASEEYEGLTEITNDTGEIKLSVGSPIDFEAVIIDRTEEYNNKSDYLDETVDQFYYAYQIYGYYGNTITIDLLSFAERLDINSDDLGVMINSNFTNEYKITREQDIATISISETEVKKYEPYNDYYNVFIIKAEKEYSSNCSGVVILSDDEIVGKDQMNQARKSNSVMNYPGLNLMCSVNATDDEKKALLCAGELMYLLNRNESINLGERDINYMPQEFMELFYYINYDDTQGAADEYNAIVTSLGANFQGDPLPKQKIPEGYKDASYCWYSRDYLNNNALKKYMKSKDTLEEAPPEESIITNNTIETEEKNGKFGIMDEFCFGNPSSSYLSSDGTFCGLCAGIAMITAEVFNKGEVQTPIGEYNKAISENETRRIIYDITKYDELNTFFDRYLGDYKSRSDNIDWEDISSLTRDEDEFLRMATCYWKKTNDVFYNKGANYYERVTLNDRTHSLLSWETVENAIEYLDNNQILLCSMNIRNDASRGHTVNLVSYERRKKDYKIDGDVTLCDTVVFDVYDSNCPGQLLKLECIRYKLGDLDTMCYRYNTGNPQYNSSFMGEDYSAGMEPGDIWIKFAIYDDSGKCINIKI